MKTTTFEDSALDELIAACCDFHTDLMQEAMKVAKKAKSKKVTRLHVETALENLRKDK
jgi:histone H3/H4